MLRICLRCVPLVVFLAFDLIASCHFLFLCTLVMRAHSNHEEFSAVSTISCLRFVSLVLLLAYDALRCARALDLRRTTYEVGKNFVEIAFLTKSTSLAFYATSKREFGQIKRIREILTIS